MRTFLTITLSLFVMACSSKEESKYSGPQPLNEGEFLTATTASSRTGDAQIVFRAIESGGEVKNKDLAKLVALVRNNCEFQNSENGDQENGNSEVLVYGPNCPISYVASMKWRTVVVDGDNYLDLVSQSKYETSNPDVLALLDVTSMASTVTFPAGDFPTTKLDLQSVTLGSVSVEDTLTADLLNTGKVKATYLRKMNVNGLQVEARIILLFRVEAGEEGDELVLENVKLLINGTSVTEEDMQRLFPDPFAEQGLL